VSPLLQSREIPGWMSDVELSWLAEAAKGHGTIIEVGSHQGRSTRTLGNNCPGTVHAVDPWPDDGTVVSPIGSKWRRDYLGVYRSFCRNLSDLIESKKVVPHRGFFEEGMFPPDFADMVFIDGDHSAAGVLRDILIAQTVLKSGGLMCGHDYGRDFGVAMSVDSVYQKKVRHMARKVGTIWWIEET
jgi:hypothetical protein